MTEPVFDPNMFSQFQPGQQYGQQQAPPAQQGYAPPQAPQQAPPGHYAPPAQNPAYNPNQPPPAQQGYAQPQYGPPAQQGYPQPPLQYGPPPGYPQYGPPAQGGYVPQPPAPAAPVVTGTLDDFDKQVSGSGKSLTFKNGDFGKSYTVLVKRDLVDTDVRQRESKGVLQYDRSGNRKWVLIIPLVAYAGHDVEQQGEDRSWWLSTHDRDALREALTAAAGVPLRTPPKGTALKITYVKDKSNGNEMANSKIKAVEAVLPKGWTPPVPVAEVPTQPPAPDVSAGYDPAMGTQQVPPVDIPAQFIPSQAEVHQAAMSLPNGNQPPADEAQSAPPWTMQPGPHGGPVAVPPGVHVPAGSATGVPQQAPAPAPAGPPEDDAVMAAMNKLFQSK